MLLKMNLKVMSTVTHEDLSHVYGLLYCRVHGASEKIMG